MALQLFDLTGADTRIRFSPYCWRTKMALKHKGLSFDAVPWRFTEKDRLAMSGQGRVPVLVDGDRVVHDSWKIALYLDEAYPDRPALMKDQAARASAKLIQSWSDRTVFAPLRPIAVAAVHRLLDGADATYFRESREKALGRSLEELSSPADQAAAYAELAAILKPLDMVLEDHPFLGGDAPFYGDYVVFGTLMWPHAVREDHALDAGSNIAGWFERMLALYDGYAAAAPRGRAV